MPVGVCEVTGVHEPEVLGRVHVGPPAAGRAAVRFIAPAVSRLSIDSDSMDPQVPDGVNGRCVKVRHLACVISITQIASLHTMQAAVSSLKWRVLPKSERLVEGDRSLQVGDRQADDNPRPPLERSTRAPLTPARSRASGF